MNTLIPKTGAAIVTITVFLFAVCLIADFSFGSYFVCMFLPIGYIMMAAGFHYESCEEQRVAATIGLIFSAIYAVLIFLVYFAQTTSVRLDDLGEQALRILDFKRGGLLFNYDLKNRSVEEIIQAGCQAEVVHEVIMPFSFVPILFSIWFGSLGVFVITSCAAFLFDSIFVIVQRFNRPRLMRILKRISR